MSFPRYPKYKASGVEWLGNVPEHWTTRRLGFYFNERREKVSDTNFEPLSVTMQGIVPRIDTAAKTDDGENRKKVCIGDFVINSRSDRKGSAGISPLNGSVSLISTVLRPQEAVCGPFIHHLLRSVNFQEEFYRFGKGIVADLWSTNYSEMRNIRLALPLLDEQNAIAAFLDRETAKIDALVAEQRRLIELLKEKRQAVISRAITKGLDPYVKLKPSGIDWLGDVPEHWTIPPLYVRYNQVLGKMLDHSKIKGEHLIPYLRNLDVRWDSINVDDLPLMDIAPHERDRFTVREGDILMVEGRELGRCAIWQGVDGEIAFQKALHRLRPRDATEHTRYFYYLMIFVNGTGAFIANCSPDEIPHLTGEELRRYRFPKPPQAEQVLIARYLDSVTIRLDTLTAEANRAIDLLQERRSALISAAVTGKIDVRGAAVVTTAVEKPYTSGFSRQMLAAAILDCCHQHPTTGRVKLQKLVHLCEYVAEIDEIQGDYQRQAAGPYDNKLMFGIANNLAKQKWFQEIKGSKGSSYKPLEKVGAHKKYLTRWQTKLPSIERILGLLGEAKTEQCEIVSTLYAAWNDLLIEGKTPNDCEIIVEASDPVRWHESKAKIEPEKWPVALEWMRKKELIPRGYGRHTKLASGPSTNDPDTDNA